MAIMPTTLQESLWLQFNFLALYAAVKTKLKKKVMYKYCPLIYHHSHIEIGEFVNIICDLFPPGTI